MKDKKKPEPTRAPARAAAPRRTIVSMSMVREAYGRARGVRRG